MKLNSNDYKSILTYYKIDFSKLTNNEIKEKAEHLLANKLCKCIKNVKSNSSNNNESKSIAICYNSVIKRKNLKTFKFKCKKKYNLLPKKGTRKLKLIKTNKRLNL